MSWRAIVSNPEDVPSVVLREVPNAVRTSMLAGARYPLTFAGAGMTGIVLCDARGRAYKAARTPSRRWSIEEEADWLRAAARVPGVREHVARMIRWHPTLLVIERECAAASGERVPETVLFDLHQRIRDRMIPHGWTAPEFKRDSWVVTRGRVPILVDASMPSRVGRTLLRYASSVLAGRKSLPSQSWDTRAGNLGSLAFQIRMEIGRTLGAAEARPVLEKLYAAGARR